MSSKWDPDDSILKTGPRAIRDATGVKRESRIVTSRDKSRRALPGRAGMPRGFKQRMHAVALPGGLMAFETTFPANTVLPSHKHANADIFRLVIEGTLFHGRTKLGPGDWMFVPHDEAYELKSGPTRAIVFHMYFPWPWPWEG